MDINEYFQNIRTTCMYELNEEHVLMAYQSVIGHMILEEMQTLPMTDNPPIKDILLNLPDGWVIKSKRKSKPENVTKESLKRKHVYDDIILCYPIDSENNILFTMNRDGYLMCSPNKNIGSSYCFAEYSKEPVMLTTKRIERITDILNQCRQSYSDLVDQIVQKKDQIFAGHKLLTECIKALLQDSVWEYSEKSSGHCNLTKNDYEIQRGHQTGEWKYFFVWENMCVGMKIPVSTDMETLKFLLDSLNDISDLMQVRGDNE